MSLTMTLSPVLEQKQRVRTLQHHHWDHDRHLRVSPMAKYKYPEKVGVLRTLKIPNCEHCGSKQRAWVVAIFESRPTPKDGGKVYRKTLEHRLSAKLVSFERESEPKAREEAGAYCDAEGVFFVGGGRWRVVQDGDSADAAEDARRTMVRREWEKENPREPAQ